MNETARRPSMKLAAFARIPFSCVVVKESDILDSGDTNIEVELMLLHQNEGDACHTERVLRTATKNMGFRRWIARAHDLFRRERT
jgi:hypothetical protein